MKVEDKTEMNKEEKGERRHEERRPRGREYGKREENPTLHSLRVKQVP